MLIGLGLASTGCLSVVASDLEHAKPHLVALSRTQLPSPRARRAPTASLSPLHNALYHPPPRSIYKVLPVVEQPSFRTTSRIPSLQIISTMPPKKSAAAAPKKAAVATPAHTSYQGKFPPTTPGPFHRTTPIVFSSQC